MMTPRALGVRMARAEVRAGRASLRRRDGSARVPRISARAGPGAAPGIVQAKPPVRRPAMCRALINQRAECEGRCGGGA